MPQKVKSKTKNSKPVRKIKKKKVKLVLEGTPFFRQ